jgi:hypothetical protein
MFIPTFWKIVLHTIAKIGSKVKWLQFDLYRRGNRFALWKNPYFLHSCSASVESGPNCRTVISPRWICCCVIHVTVTSCAQKMPIIYTIINSKVTRHQFIIHLIRESKLPNREWIYEYIRIKMWKQNKTKHINKTQQNNKTKKMFVTKSFGRSCTADLKYRSSSFWGAFIFDLLAFALK